MSIIKMKWKRSISVLLLFCMTLSLGLGSVYAAAPGISLTSSGLLTSNGYSVVSYTGYLNGESFQQDAITTYNGWQYAVYWNSAKHVNIARRQLPSGAWQNIEFTDYTTTSTDSHNTISMGISYADGTIHIAYDMHNTTLKYRKSVAGMATNPGTAVWNASSFGATTSSLGSVTMPTSLTYPVFLNAPGNKFQFSIRSGSSGSGDQMLYEYDTAGNWSSIGRYVDGISTSKNAYFFGTEYDSAGRLHTTWTWRETPDGSSNHDIYYAYSDDQGRTWKNNAGTVIATTGSTYITPSSPGISVWTIPQNRGLMNQESQVVDSDGIVHVLASHLPSSAPDDSNFTSARNNSVIYHYYRDLAGVWHQQESTYQEASQRGDIMVDSANNLYIVFGNSNTNKLNVATASKASNWTDWTIQYTSTPIYFSDPLIDHARSKLENVMSVFSPQKSSGNIDILDFNLNCACTPAAPAAPISLTATSISSSQINLSWTAPSGTVSGYNIFRDGAQVGTTTTATSFSDIGLAAGTTYSYYVQAYNTGGTSPASNTASATPQNNYAISSTVTASSTYETTSWGTAKVKDGITTSTGTAKGWTSNNSLTTNHTEWIQFDIGSSVSMNTVDVYPRNDSPNIGYGFPVNFTIQTSMDGVAWTTHVTQTNYPLPGGTVQSFTFSATTARYMKVTGTSLRVNPNDGNKYRMQFAEVAIH